MKCENTEAIFQYCLEYGKFEYEDLASTWRDIERKAQGNIAIAGVFLAGASLVYRAVSCPSIGLNIGFVISVFLLALSAVFAVTALSISSIEAIEDSKDIRNEVEHMLKCYSSGIPEDRYRQFIFARKSAWLRVNTGLHEENIKKVHWLAKAQKVLRIGIIFAFLVVTYSVYEVYKPGG